MLLSAFCAIVLVAALVTGTTWLTAHFVTLEKGWLDTSINWIVGIILGIGGWFMLPAFIVLVSGIFQDVTINRVEKADYPDPVSFFEAARTDSLPLSTVEETI